VAKTGSNSINTNTDDWGHIWLPKLEQKQLKMGRSKTIVYPRSIPPIFQSKNKSFDLFVVVFLFILVGWESYMTPRQPIGVQQGEGGSHMESSLLPIGHLGVILNSQPHCYALFIAIWIRVKR
jgi:hypothetical protein